jgi:AcrR family transcriptional regulator
MLDAAAIAIAEHGPAAMSLRDLARRAGVSHAAPAHHFGDKAGLLTALAAEGYQLMADALRATYERTGSFLEVGVAYVGFAVDHPAHFRVMFRPDLLRDTDPELRAAMAASRDALYGSARSVSRPADPDPRQPAIAGWALVHGLATLYLDGNLPPDVGNDPRALARTLASYLFAGSPRAESTSRT